MTTKTQIDDAVVELWPRVEKLLRGINHAGMSLGSYAEIGAIVALLPEPPVTDPDVLLMRQVMHAVQYATPETQPEGGNMRWLKGYYDHLPQAIAVVAAIKAARS